MERELDVTLVAYQSSAMLKLAKPSTSHLKRVKTVEKETGLVLVAYELAGEEPSDPYVVSELEAKPVELSEKQLERLRAVEEEVGLTLMAYNA
jgi:hypothetical protein